MTNDELMEHKRRWEYIISLLEKGFVIKAWQVASRFRFEISAKIDPKYLRDLSEKWEREDP